MPPISRITVYPIKSLDGHGLSVCTVLPTGALAFDRRYALVDAKNNFVNAKRCPAIHLIRAAYSEGFQRVTLSWINREREFDLSNEQVALATWCGEILGIECRLVENPNFGMPDDTKSPGPTWISTATLETMSSWFDGLELAETRRRFRMNFEVGGVPTFWEDSLVGEPGKMQRFRCGQAIWQGRGICQRCVVPSRQSQEGTVTPDFARQFARRRESSLPDWSPRGRFDHFYRLGVNSTLEAGGRKNVIQIGDEVELLGSE